jgi:hypothetical protein
MNKFRGAVLAWAVAFAMMTAAFAQNQKTGRGEEFFIIASVDQPRAQLLLKHPTEVTTLLNVAKTTQILDQNGKPLRLADLRAGDTVWVVSSSSGTSATATRIRKGPMTVAELHRSYLDYPEIP